MNLKLFCRLIKSKNQFYQRIYECTFNDLNIHRKSTYTYNLIEILNSNKIAFLSDEEYNQIKPFKFTKGDMFLISDRNENDNLMFCVFKGKVNNTYIFYYVKLNLFLRHNEICILDSNFPYRFLDVNPRKIYISDFSDYVILNDDPSYNGLFSKIKYLLFEGYDVKNPLDFFKKAEKQGLPKRDLNKVNLNELVSELKYFSPDGFICSNHRWSLTRYINLDFIYHFLINSYYFELNKEVNYFKNDWIKEGTYFFVYKQYKSYHIQEIYIKNYDPFNYKYVFPTRELAELFINKAVKFY